MADAIYFRKGGQSALFFCIDMNVLTLDKSLAHGYNFVKNKPFSHIQNMILVQKSLTKNFIFRFAIKFHF